MQELLPPLVSILRDIEKYDSNPRQTPKEILLQLVKKVFDNKMTLIELLAIGGEGVVLKLLDETGKQVVAKIARAESQNPLVTAAKNQDEHGRPLRNPIKEQRNLYYARFLRGAKLQQDFFDLLLEERVTFFGVPQVRMISTQPLYLLMPFLENTGVLRFFTEHKKTIVQILDVFVHLLEAVKYIHSKGIVHRDLKSDNLLISRSFDSVMILDWTLAKPVGVDPQAVLTLKGTQGGSVGFAPEKLIEDGDFRNANFADDIHALGFVLWEFATGKRLPSVLGNTIEGREKIKARITKYLPDALQLIFLQATEKDETKRPTIDEFLHYIVEAIKAFGLWCTSNMVSFVSEKQAEEIDVIIDTDVVFENDNKKTQKISLDVCLDCKLELECRKYKACNRFLEAVQAMKKESII